MSAVPARSFLVDLDAETRLALVKSLTIAGAARACGAVLTDALILEMNVMSNKQVVDIVR